MKSLKELLIGRIQGDKGVTLPVAPYPARSNEFNSLIGKVENLMRSYQKRLTRGGASNLRDPDRILVDGYRWSNGPVALGLRESDGYHGGDYIGIREQVLVDQSDSANPKSLGVITYERGDGSLHAYSIFSLNGNSAFKETTDDYEKPARNGEAETNLDKPPITVNDFISSIYSERSTPELRELRSRVRLTPFLMRRR